jgi:hypothetical protein
MRCGGCGADFPGSDGPTHAYVLSSPGCWAAYGEVLAREYEDSGFRAVHRLTVDAYALQHPGEESPQAQNSVGIHLSRMALIFGRGWSVEEANRAMVAITAKKTRYPWLIPPRHRGELTVRDILAARRPAEHCAAVERWADSVWTAWHEHHAEVLSWIAEP